MKSKKHLFFVSVSVLVLISSIPIFGNASSNVETVKNANEDVSLFFDDAIDLSENLVTKEEVTAELVIAPSEIDLDSNDGVTEIMYPQNPRARGDQVPSIYHQLTTSSSTWYTCSFPQTSRITSTYTNAYFNPNSSGELHVSVDNMITEQMPFGGSEIKISCYEVGSNKLVSSWTGGTPIPSSSIKFHGLSTSKNYYFKFTIDWPSSISGYCKIMNW